MTDDVPDDDSAEETEGPSAFQGPQLAAVWAEMSRPQRTLTVLAVLLVLGSLLLVLLPITVTGADGSTVSCGSALSSKPEGLAGDAAEACRDAAGTRMLVGGVAVVAAVAMALAGRPLAGRLQRRGSHPDER